MDIHELYNLTQWYRREVTSTGILSLYNHLHSILYSNSQNAAKQPFDDQRSALHAALSGIDTNYLNMQQISVLQAQGVYNWLNPKASVLIEDILATKGLDIASAVQELQNIISIVSSSTAKIEAIESALKEIVPEEIVPSDNKITVRLHFQHDAGIRNIVELKEWSNSIHEIGRGFAMIQNDAPESVEIIGAERGSIIVVMSVVASLGVTFSKVTSWILEVLQRVLAIQEQAVKIRGMQLSNTAIEVELLKEAEEAKKNGVDSIVKRVHDELVAAGTKKIDGEKTSAFKRAVEGLFGFIDKGGTVDISCPDVTEDSAPTGDLAAIDSIRGFIADIKNRESDIKLLEHFIKENPPSGTEK